MTDSGKSGTEDELKRLTAEVISTLDRWKIGDEATLLLLGFPEETRPRVLTRLRHGSQQLAEEARERGRNILGIQRALEITFPLNRHMPGFWLTTHDRHLKGMPLEIMVNEGLDGLERVWRRLDCTRNWEDG
ncbi:MAG: hypothetical protein HQL48_08900 [Gammaproteobacteria bacterium]|nr:hypothetical protein [Gammaproteobacteria bacterium]